MRIVYSELQICIHVYIYIHTWRFPEMQTTAHMAWSELRNMMQDCEALEYS